MSDTLDPIVDELTSLVAAEELTDEQLARGEELVAQAAKWREDQKAKAESEARAKSLRDALSVMGPGAVHPAAPPEAKAAGLLTGPAPAILPASEQFLASKSYQGFLADFPNGLPESARVNLPPVNVGGLKAFIGPSARDPQTKAVIGSGDAGGLVTPPMQYPYPAYPWGYPLAMRDVVTNGTTGSDTVEYARVLTAVSAAAPVAEAGDTAGSGLKPESSLTFQKITAAVKTIAHWLAATKRSLSDAGQLRTLIDSFLRFGLEQELEDQMLNGDGTGENFQGILNTPGTLTVAHSVNAIETIRKGITAVQVTGLVQPNAVLLNPADAEGLDLAKDGNERYYGAGPFGAGPTTIWGLPRVVTTALAAGTAVVGDFRQAVLWDREQATITASDSHADFFIRNLVAILAEMRAAFGVIRPQAFAECDLTAA